MSTPSAIAKMTTEEKRAAYRSNQARSWRTPMARFNAICALLIASRPELATMDRDDAYTWASYYVANWCGNGPEAIEHMLAFKCEW